MLVSPPGDVCPPVILSRFLAPLTKHDAGRGAPARPRTSPFPTTSYSLSPRRSQVNKYLELHNLEAILADAVNEAVSARAADPVSFIADTLSKLRGAALTGAAADGEGKGEGEAGGER